MTLIQKIRQKASQQSVPVVFPEAGRDPRVIRAARRLADEGWVKPVLLGHREVIEKMAEDGNLSAEGLTIYPPDSPRDQSHKYEFFKEKMAHKNPDRVQLEELCADPLFTAGWMMEAGRAEAAVAGSIASTGQVIVSALRTVGVAPGSELVSSTFLMEMPDGRVFTYADCAVVPYPDATQLASIAVDSARMHRKLTGEEPRIAFLSFSTRGSARHEKVEFVQDAVRKARELKPRWAIDGEMQFDAAAVPAVAERKAPDSSVAGRANVFIFPNLDAGNIAYKITERLAGATATGPLLQGLSKPYMDLSRGCSVEDIINTACVAAVLAAGQNG